MSSDPRYPIGAFSLPQNLTPEQRAKAMENIGRLPQRLRAAVERLSAVQTDTPYRSGGWSVRQTVHHVADSHMQAFSRIRKALTEDWPAVTPYKEDLWSELTDSRTLPLELSLQILEPLHARWTVLLRSIGEPDWTERGYTHSTVGRHTLEQVLALYDWHGRHHTAHITALRERMGW